MMSSMAEVIVPKSDQWNADDFISGPITFTITGVKIVGGQEQPVSISVTGSPKVYRPCKSMSRVLVAAWGPDANAYVGRSLTLYRDPKVKWGGLEVGGIRIRAMSHIEREMTMMLTMSKANRAPHKVAVLKDGPAQTEQQKPATVSSDDVLAEARIVARKGTEAFRAWFKDNPGKRDAVRPIMDDLKALCTGADMSAEEDPFGLPPLAGHDAETGEVLDPLPTPEERDRAMREAQDAAAAAAKDAAE